MPEFLTVNPIPGALKTLYILGFLLIQYDLTKQYITNKYYGGDV